MSEDKDILNLTDDEDNDDFEEESQLPEISGILNKWTNYIHGWQDRFVVLKEGTLSYYKSETDTTFGCRGAVSLAKAIITPHEFDECRFDVSVNDCLWYLRTESVEDRQRWIDGLELHRQAESGYGSENSLRRHGSMLSLTSAASLSTTSTSSFKRGRGLNEKLMEMETFKDILSRQVDTLQNYFDSCASAISKSTIHDVAHDDIDEVDDYDQPSLDQADNAAVTDKEISNVLRQHGAHALDFKGEAFTFKATTAGIIATLSHCIELMNQREEAWRKRLEREIEKRKKVEEAYKSRCAERQIKPIVIGGPDYEASPHCAINEDEFFDAVDATLDKLEKEEERKQTRPLKAVDRPPIISLDPKHPLYNEINSVIAEHMRYADMDPKTMEETWPLIYEEGDMRVYKREIEEDGMIVDPLKAIHTVSGVTGHEICHYFYNPEVRMDWEGTLESTKTMEYLSEDSLVTYQVHKRVWPTAQRDTYFWSHIRHCPSEDDSESADYWVVCNHSTDYNESNCQMVAKCVRVLFNVALICQTIVEPPPAGKEISRDNLRCRIQYSANVNPGGWAPASVLRAVYKREYPKFLKRFTQYVIDQTKDKPIMF
ncbi:unnamed protein product [Owenia fusiformis]|uniref:Ceramide transfer protein n=1 Tax=Owenia fusiformis TaxID=6347 RepID=A0A8S4PRV9_OWEFU|nr:unnamed protein product [Owenia fusiformis]